MKDEATYRAWEYANLGDYHRNLDPNWSYTPTYLKKMKYVLGKISDIGQSANILDAGCGEGVLVEKLKSHGYSISGIDLNYESKNVKRGSVLNMPYPDNIFDMVLLLDVFEHLAFEAQPVALNEIKRVLKTGGVLIASIPNLAHWNSRFRFFFRGNLDRTDTELYHIGERPFKENRAIIERAGYTIEEIKNITLTVPFIYRRLICRQPAKFRWLHDALQPFAVPSLSMLNIFYCRNLSK